MADIASAPLHACYADELVSAVRAWAEPATINNVPVQQEGGLIGVLENINGDITGAPVPAADQRVRNVMRPLAQDMLVEGRQPSRIHSRICSSRRTTGSSSATA